jgi:Pentapeptide repeats (8 copies)
MTHLKRLHEGVEAWNLWRASNPDEIPDLRGARLGGLDLQRCNLASANLEFASLHRTKLRGANLSHAILRDANLRNASLSGARLTGAYLRGANLTKAYLRGADLTGAELVNVNLQRAVLVEARLNSADLTGARVHGTAVWDVHVDDSTQQHNLIITPSGKPDVTVDDLEVAQFVYLLLNNRKIRDVITTIGQRAVLILGRFSPPDRKEVLDGIAEKLRQMGFLPILFDFEKSDERDFTETIRILAGLSLFVIVDITKPRAVPLELQATVPDYRIPFVTILQQGEQPFSMFKDLTAYDWVLQPVITYGSREAIVAGLEHAVVNPALRKHVELVNRRAAALRTQSVEELLTEIGSSAAGSADVQPAPRVPSEGSPHRDE